MSIPNDPLSILDRIARGQATEAEFEALRQLLTTGKSQNVVQFGKYNINLEKGQGDIHIGDRIYQGSSAEAIRDIVRSVLQEFSSNPSPKPPDPKSVDELVQEVRSRLHDDIQALHGTMPLWGIDHWVPLGDLFVDVNILEELSSSRRSELEDLWQDFNRKPNYRSLDRIGLGEARQRLSGLEILGQDTHLMIVGKPGSGKTTYLQRIVTECNAGKLQPHRIPVMIKLREFVDDGCENAYSIERYLEKYWRLSEAETQLLLHQGRALILLDGLDEAIGEAGNKITKQIKFLARTFPQILVIVTCRTQSFTGDSDWKSHSFTFVEVADFNELQVRSFIDHWFKVITPDSSVGLGKVNVLLEILFSEENKAIRELTITPILLSLTCAIFYRTGKFYSKVSRLYEEGLEVLLEQWDDSRNIERDEVYRDLSVEKKLELLSHLAVNKFKQEQYILFEQTEIEKAIADFLRISQRSSHAVLKSVEAQHGLLIERAQKIWTFSHLTFQEYLVAKEYEKQDSWRILMPKIIQDNWREVFFMISDILPNPHLFILNMKEFADSFIEKEDRLFYFLEWLNRRSDSTTDEVDYIVLKAFYFEISLALALASEKAETGKLFKLGKGGHTLFLKGTFSLRLTKACRSVIQEGGTGNRETSRDYSLIYALVLSLALASDSVKDSKSHLYLVEAVKKNLKRALKNSIEAHEREAISEFVNHIHLEPKKFLNMKDIKDDEDLYLVRDGKIQEWKIQCKEWSTSLRSFISQNYDIGQEWNFSDVELLDIYKYYCANITLIYCLKSGCHINENIKFEVAKSMLQPV